jgi:integrase
MDLRPLTEEEVNQYLEVLDLREKLIARLAILEGMRPGEILALRWKSVAGDIVRVEQRLYKRVLGTPKNGKAREAAISDGTLSLLKQWAELAQVPSPDGFVFPSERIATPMSLDNLWRRCMLPKLEKIGLEWATFRYCGRPTPACPRSTAWIRRLLQTSGGTESASAWMCIPVPTWSRSAKLLTNSKQGCFENGNPNAGPPERTGLNGVNGVTRNR